MKPRLQTWIETIKERPLYRLLGGVVILAMLGVGVYAALEAYNTARRYAEPRTQLFLTWIAGDKDEREDLLTIRDGEACPAAPFILPTDGFIGLIYGDPRGPYSERSPHQGIDVFSNTDPGVSPVYAAYDGYITREDSWRSALIQRVPDDPLNPGRQIWLYYTHMADSEGNTFIVDAFPPGTREIFVEQGTLIGYTGDYNGEAVRDVWVHLHFSIVLDDGFGAYTNELDFDNTVDPSRYLGMNLNYGCAGADLATCTADPICNDAILGAGGF